MEIREDVVDNIQAVKPKLKTLNTRLSVRNVMAITEKLKFVMENKEAQENWQSSQNNYKKINLEHLIK
jgi:hypothetical protein